MEYMNYHSQKFEKKFQPNEVNKVIQFCECPFSSKIDSYIFQDLSVSYLLNVYQKNKELIPFLGMNNLSLSYLKKRTKRQNHFYQSAKGIFTMSQWLKDFLVETGIPDYKVHAVGGGINIDPSKIDYSNKKGNKILFVGRDFYRKGGDLVVNAFKLAKLEKRDLELYIVGPNTNPIKENIEGVFFLGEKEREELIDIFNACDIFCMPSRFEAYGLVFAEALSFGLPCIGRNSFAMKEFITPGENGYLISNDDEEDLAEKILIAINNSELYKNIKDTKDFYLEKYSWSSVVKRMISVIDN